MKDLLQTIAETKQKRAKVVADQKGILAKAREENRSQLTTDEETAYNNAETDFTSLDQEVRRLEALKEREERIALEQHQTGTYVTTSTQEEREAEKPDVTYRKAFGRYLRHGIQNLTDEERSTLKKFYKVDNEQRAQTVTTTGGGYAIPTGFSGIVEQILKYYGPMIDPSVCGSLNTESGNTLNYPTLNGTSTSGRLLAINTGVTTTDLTFGQVAFDAYKFSSDQILVPVELLEDEMVNLEDVIANQLGERLGRIINTYLTTGTGSSQPNGIVTASSAGKTAASQTVFTRDEIIDLVHSVDRAYRMSPKTGFMLNDAILAVIKKMTIGSGDDRPLWQVSVREGEPDRLEGYPYWVNNDMAATVVASAKTILFGDYSKYLVRRVSQLRMLRLAERYADADQVGFVGFMRLDGDLIASGSVKHLVMAA